MMSIQIVGTILNLTRASRKNIPQFFRNFSKKNDYEDPYQYVKRKRVSRNGEGLVWKDPNFELLASTSSVDFPFYLPGNVGLAWFDKKTTLRTPHHKFVMKQKDLTDDITCSIQECPKVLRQTVYDLFPSRNFETSELSVVTISLKPNHKLMRQNKEEETEKLAQTFIIAAKTICDKIRKAGYWADFINPFSGLPYLSRDRINNAKLYESNEKFRCLDFQIFEIEHCKIISNELEGNGKRFIGSLFTTAPCIEENIVSIFV
ncbi:cobalamin trafficking protein CblD isoform X2 [Coccinella septempunctata]|uniref:cobalamin trafficking protein CblD isoform X2 n=1 Tax=Coccinella septempunctata TaxID=41139 RepID=UPI001D069CF1|nr:cobalamin trafficking protein CblD isoform X2 [Coccinella septempunctata]